jgi:hypothetical protein
VSFATDSYVTYPLSVPNDIHVTHPLSQKCNQSVVGSQLGYLGEIEQRISQHFSTLGDEDLTTPYDAEKEHGDTRLGHYVYALRHTMHHHGALSLLSLTYGNQQGTWE